jgi:hypothetical protein
MMSEVYTSTELLTIIRQSLRDIGYQDSLLKKEYRFEDVFTNDYAIQQIELAAFAQEPSSYRNACFGVVIPPHDGPEALMRYTALGAPQIFTFRPETQRVCRWKIRAKDGPILVECIEPDQLHATIVSHKVEWNPEQVLRAKSIGFGKEAAQLDFFDAGFMPTLESFVYEKLDKLLKETIASSELAYKEYINEDIDDKAYKSLFRLIFRLVAAKLLGDRNYPGNWLSVNAQDVIREVESFYSMPSGNVLSNGSVQDVAWRKIRNAFSFQNLSVEALAYVYENTLVSTETRKKYGTHATAHTLAEYLVQSLPIEQLNHDERYIFEPFAGHAPFLIAALQRLRSLLPLDISAEQRHNYFVKMLAGMEIDAFACEVARYSLILADYPNPNGWLIENDSFFAPSASAKLQRFLERAQVVLCNPPYEDFTLDDREKGYATHSTNRAVEALSRVLDFKPKMLGFVLPRSFIDGKQYLQARRQIAEHYDDVSLTILPDNAFHYSELETVLLTAYERRTSQPIWSSAQVKKADFQTFTSTGMPTWQMKAAESFIKQEIDSPDPHFWYTPMQPVWDALAHLPYFESIADIHIGIQHNIPFKENQQSLVSSVPKANFVPGLTSVTDDFEPYIIQSFSYLNVDPAKMYRANALLLRWNQSKVITNAVRLSRGPWTIAAALDEKGLVCMQNFHGIWSHGQYPLEVIAALLNGPVANAFLSTHNTTKHNKLGTTRQIPVPELRPSQIRLIVSLVQEYISYREQWLAQPERSKHFERLCKGIIKQIDAEILAAYNLASHLERRLLTYFDGYAKPGPLGLMQIKPSPSKRLYTSLIKIENIREEEHAKFIEAVIMNWNPHQIVRLPIALIPDSIQGKLERDVWLLAHVNVGAQTAEDLFFEDIELAPEPHDKLA